MFDEKKKGKKLSIEDLPADHPIYKRGFVVGYRNASNFSRPKQEKPSSSETEKPGEKESSED